MKLSYKQRAVLRAMDTLGDSTARDIAQRTGQSSDGAAYTLRSLVRRELVSTGHHDGERYNYRLTEAGLSEARAAS